MSQTLNLVVIGRDGEIDDFLNAIDSAKRSIGPIKTYTATKAVEGVGRIQKCVQQLGVCHAAFLSHNFTAPGKEDFSDTLRKVILEKFPDVPVVCWGSPKKGGELGKHFHATLEFSGKSSANEASSLVEVLRQVQAGEVKADYKDKRLDRRASMARSVTRSRSTNFSRSQSSVRDREAGSGDEMSVVKRAPSMRRDPSRRRAPGSSQSDAASSPSLPPATGERSNTGSNEESLLPFFLLDGSMTGPTGSPAPKPTSAPGPAPYVSNHTPPPQYASPSPSPSAESDEKAHRYGGQPTGAGGPPNSSGLERGGGGGGGGGDRGRSPTSPAVGNGAWVNGYSQQCVSHRPGPIPNGGAGSPITGSGKQSPSLSPSSSQIETPAGPELIRILFGEVMRLRVAVEEKRRRDSLMSHHQPQHHQPMLGESLMQATVNPPSQQQQPYGYNSCNGNGQAHQKMPYEMLSPTIHNNVAGGNNVINPVDLNHYSKSTAMAAAPSGFLAQNGALGSVGVSGGEMSFPGRSMSPGPGMPSQIRASSATGMYGIPMYGGSYFPSSTNVASSTAPAPMTQGVGFTAAAGGYGGMMYGGSNSPFR